MSHSAGVLTMGIPYIVSWDKRYPRSKTENTNNQVNLLAFTDTKCVWTKRACKNVITTLIVTILAEEIACMH